MNEHRELTRQQGSPAERRAAARALVYAPDVSTSNAAALTEQYEATFQGYVNRQVLVFLPTGVVSCGELSV